MMRRRDKNLRSDQRPLDNPPCRYEIGNVPDDPYMGFDCRYVGKVYRDFCANICPTGKNKYR